MERRTDGSGHSHAKIILIGEHSVVYGQPAIALPLTTIQAEARLSFRKDHQQLLRSSYFDGPLEDLPSQMAGLGHLIKTILQQEHQEQVGFTLTIESHLPAERGMGSSAAVAIAIIRCLYDAFHLNLTHSQTLRLADISETDTHKNPSGLDAATAASDNPIWLIRGHEPSPLPINMDAYLLICDSGIKGQTSKAIQLVKSHLAQSPVATQKHLSGLGQLTLQVREQLAQNDVVGLGQSLNQAQQHLKAIGVSTPGLDHLIQLAVQNGALGSKLTGGGCGGCFINLAPNRTVAEKLATILQEHGITNYWIQPLSPNAGGAACKIRQ
ncbi:mevalonate kinase [Ligilactobacillus pabuli]|uniref:Mevalonate kinase n=1 Tax=Ligilactobacillus pabuli TaxID=2886039 RepID=A0ABQ5JED6_9LACO|nr:mevalonate kinase [Ligilactobacillus pabuli]GKS80382.1 mevalonate kinase [Ligilactobacillus pabuli]